MKFLSLFSGIGGFDLAFTRAGMQSVGAVEIDKACQSVLHNHFPDVTIFDDVKKAGKATHDKGSIDVICGGFPCQDLSVAGKRAGLAGERSGLWFEFARVIDELDPGWVVIENVPGLLSSNKGKDFAIILQWLAERGYGVCWRILDAQYFGVPQRRRRVFIVASLGSGRAAEVLFESKSVSGDIAKGRKAGKEVAVATLGHSQSHGLGIGMQSQANTLEVPSSVNQAIIMAHGQANAEIVRDGEPSLTDNHEAPIVFTEPNGGGQGGKGLLIGGDRSFSESGQPQYVFDARGNGNGEIVPNLTGDHGNRVTDYTPIIFDANRDGLQNDENIAPTMKHGGDGDKAHSAYPKISVTQPTGVRRLTPTECERLQGFPDGWTAGQSDSARYRQLGNAVAVPVVEWIANRIVQAK